MRAKYLIVTKVERYLPLNRSSVILPLEFAEGDRNVIRLRLLALLASVVALVVVFGITTDAQHAGPSLAFGNANISLGMTPEQVEKHLADANRHIEFMKEYKDSALVRINNSAEPEGDEGQVIFSNGRLVYAAFDFPSPGDTHELAQELAGAVDAMDSKQCRVSNFSGHGTGGGYSETRFDCGAKGFEVITVDSLGTNDRNAPELKMTIGALPRAK